MSREIDLTPDAKARAAGLRLSPWDERAEASLLGSILRDNSLLSDVLNLVRAGSFYKYAHQVLFDCMVELIVVRAVPADAVTVADLVQDRELQEDIGGYQYLIELWEAATISHALEHAQIVRGYAIKRALLRASKTIEELALSPGSDWQCALDGAEASLFAISGKVRTTEIVPFSKAVDEMLDRMDARKKRQEERLLLTGITAIDRVLDGIDEGNLICIGARTGIGKTVLAMNLAFNIAEQGRPVLVVSLEQSRVELAERVVSSRSQVEAWRIRKGLLLETQEASFFTAVSDVKGSKVFITDTPGQTVMTIAAAIRQKVAKDGVTAVFIDYLQLIAPDDERAKRHEQVGKMTRDLKLVARQTGVRIFILAQINRESEKSGDKRPRLDQLRESGSIEQDSDIVLLLHRPDKTASEMEVIIAKNRHGLESIVSVYFDKNRLKIMDVV